MDKLVYEGNGAITISNDGATIMKLLDIIHPAALTLVEIAKSQDEEVGDGTTTVVILAGEFLKEAKEFIETGVHPTDIIRGYTRASELAKQKINELSVNINKDEKQGINRGHFGKVVQLLPSTANSFTLTKTFFLK